MNETEKLAKSLYDEETKDLPVPTRNWEDLHEEVKQLWIDRATNQKE